MSELIAFDFELNGINIHDNVGKEVTINWQFEDFEDDGKFWTDSNGMEMQERIKDHRFSYDLDLSGQQNISWNYYPVNSAIAMRNQVKNGTFTDKGVQVTIMNERSQAGSATLTKGNIEIIHNRRLVHDDSRGVGEPLNETDKNGFGMKVNARYWLNIFDLEHEKSSQRQLQNAIDKPLSFFFSEIKKEELSQEAEFIAEESSDLLDLREALSDKYAFENFGRAVMFPFNRNKIMVRLENIADKFDMYTPDLKINMEKFAYLFWKSANPESKTEMKFKITEHDLTVNMYEKEVEWMRKKSAWKGQDDEAIKEVLAKDPEMRAVYERDHLADSMDEITLVPQEMRTFVIYYYKPKPEAEFMQS